MAEMKEGGGWVSTLRQYSARLNKDSSPENVLEEGGDTVEDRKLLEECYIQLKGEAGNKYSILPKFYSKVCEYISY